MSSVHLKPESKADSSSYNYIFCIFGLKKYTLIEEDSLILKDFYLIIYCHIKKFSLRFVLGFRTAIFEGWEKA